MGIKHDVMCSKLSINKQQPQDERVAHPTEQATHVTDCLSFKLILHSIQKRKMTKLRVRKKGESQKEESSDHGSLHARGSFSVFCTQTLVNCNDYEQRFQIYLLGVCIISFVMRDKKIV